MLGNTLTKVETSFEPSVEITPLDSTDEGTYTLAMLDPDAPFDFDGVYLAIAGWGRRVGIEPRVCAQSRMRLDFGFASRAMDSFVHIVRAIVVKL